ncbi:MAG: 2-oxoacid:acceptor oxidoreductase family protein [Dehalococcoidales bacterium]|nr:2-oxoacid:acceptor oxidoreductase family protein [Dehalococcoidales bacterium]MDP6632165.1 2-oxoacid:acceptor oxidoreductase family protein [Dehalococcoidales bacterium]
MKEIRFHGRAGQGARLASEILAEALVLEGKSVSAFPMFGAERRGAPVSAFLRFDDNIVRETTQVYEPDCLVIIDAKQIKPDTFRGIKPGGIAVLNTVRLEIEKPHQNVEFAGFVDATGIALELIGRAIVNTCMLGVFVRTTQWVKLDSVLAGLEQHFTGDMLEKNAASLKRGFDEARIISFKAEE